LDDGTGAISTALKPLADMLLAGPRPASMRSWLNHPHVGDLLQDLLTGRIALTHDGLSTYSHLPVARHMRNLLISCALLPAGDPNLLAFEAWLHHRLPKLAEHTHERLLRLFGRWYQLPKLRTGAAEGPLRPTAHFNACRRFNAAVDFLDWLPTRAPSLKKLTQADIDFWYATHKVHARQVVITFLTWAMTNRHMPRLVIPRMRFNPGVAMTQQRRLDLLHHYLTHDELHLATRVAVCLMLLYAQPLTRIQTLSLDDITRDEDGYLVIAFGDPPSPVPEPFATLLVTLMLNREDLGSVTHEQNPWLFPGRNSGRPIGRETLFKRVNALGFPIREARISALRQLVLEALAPVISDALGFHRTTTARQVLNAGATWSRYAAQDPDSAKPAP
jgi:hypothetical protein